MSRLCVAILASIQLLIGVVYTTLSILATNALNKVVDDMTRMALFLHILVYALLILVSILGISGAIKRRRKIISFYWSSDLAHVVCAIASGAFLFSYLFRSPKEDQDTCLLLKPVIVQELCYKTVTVKAVSVTFIILNWILELVGLNIINKYCAQLTQEETAKVEKETFGDEDTSW